MAWFFPVAEEGVGGIDMAGEYSQANRQFFLNLGHNEFLNRGFFWALEMLSRPADASLSPSVLEMQPFIIIFLNKAGQWPCKCYLNKSICLLEIKPKGK